MAGITIAWLVGEGIIVWRSVAKNHRPPMPGELLGSAGFFALLALLAEYQPARGFATVMAFGIDIAAYLQAPLITPATQRAAAAAPAAGEGTPSGGAAGVGTSGNARTIIGQA